MNCRASSGAALALVSLTGACCAPGYLAASYWQTLRQSERLIHWNVVARLPHSTRSYTEGLVFAGGRLFESVGRYDESRLIEVDPQTGAVLASVPDPKTLPGAADRFFAEGIAVDGEQLIQLSWKSHLGVRWDLRTMKMAGTVAYQGEGWGLCFDGVRYLRSDGTSNLRIHARDFSPGDSIPVALDGTPINSLNELECKGGDVYANVWQTPFIVRIEATSGRVTGVLDLKALVDEVSAKGAESVLNGIAFDPRGRLFVTGKHWKALYVLELSS